jgi:hypothetical protein
MDTDLVKCLLITIIPYVIIFALDRYSWRNKIIITNDNRRRAAEQHKEAFDLVLREQS